MKYAIPAFAAVLILLLGACSQEPPAPPQAERPQRTAAPVPAAEVDVAQDVAQPQEPPYVYDPAGRRDPFTPLVLVRRPVVQSDAPLTPLQTFEIGQLRLTGVIIGKGTPRAMVVAPDGKSYILQQGVLVGKNNGVVREIRRDGVFVEERYYDFSGEVRTNVLEISLPKREGV